MIVVIKGAGDLATGVACRLKSCGFSVLMTETPQPTTVRRTVAFSRAVYEGMAQVEGFHAVLVSDKKEAEDAMSRGWIPVMVDPEACIVREISPDVVVDAILAKRNINTSRNDAPVVIALGPGFSAGTDCHAVVETMRGHFLGKVYYRGSAIPNTGIPGEVGGYTKERILRAPCEGIFRPCVEIGDRVQKGDRVALVDGSPVTAQLSGIVRGLLQDGVPVVKGMKSGDVDPRCKREYCFSVSDKARSIAGGVLEAIIRLSPSSSF